MLINLMLIKKYRHQSFDLHCRNTGLKWMNFNNFQYPAAATTEYWEALKQKETQRYDME